MPSYMYLPPRCPATQLLLLPFPRYTALYLLQLALSCSATPAVPDVLPSALSAAPDARLFSYEMSAPPTTQLPAESATPR
jgi:hypothetical protein